MSGRGNFDVGRYKPQNVGSLFITNGPRGGGNWSWKWALTEATKKAETTVSKVRIAGGFRSRAGSGCI